MLVYNSKKALLTFLACGSILAGNAASAIESLIEDNDASFVLYPMDEDSVLAVSEVSEIVIGVCEQGDQILADNHKQTIKQQIISETNISTSTISEEDFALSDSLAESDLDDSRGAADTSGVAVLTAVSANNEIGNNVQTGANNIGKGAFSASQGVTTVIQNSGNNVTIQSATVVNMTINQ